MSPQGFGPGTLKVSHSVPKTTRDQAVIPKDQKLETFKIFVFELFIIPNSIAKVKAAFQNAHNISQSEE